MANHLCLTRSSSRRGGGGKGLHGKWALLPAAQLIYLYFSPQLGHLSPPVLQSLSLLTTHCWSHVSPLIHIEWPAASFHLWGVWRFTLSPESPPASTQELWVARKSLYCSNTNTIPHWLPANKHDVLNPLLWWAGVSYLTLVLELSGDGEGNEPPPSAAPISATPPASAPPHRWRVLNG